MGTIVDDDTLTWSIDDVTVDEGGQATFTVSLNRISATDQSVNFATSHGTAGRHGLHRRTGTLTIPDGATSGTIEVETPPTPSTRSTRRST